MKFIGLRILFLVAVLMLAAVTHSRNLSQASAATQQDSFIAVEGGSFKSKLDQAIRLAGARSSRFWVAYGFDVRPGVAVDYEWRNERGNVTINRGVSISTRSNVETRNLGVFLLYEPKGDSLARLEVFNLDRRREYSGYPVYWLGRASNQESLNLLRGFAEAHAEYRVMEQSVMAIAIHDDPQVDAILENLIRTSTKEKIRTTAVFWLGQSPGKHPLLADLARNEQESIEVRKQAVFAIGVGGDTDAMSTLRSLWDTVSTREVKKQIIFAASINSNEQESVNFLIKVAESDDDRSAQKEALFWLGQKAGKRSLEVLGKTVESNDADTEVQKQAVFAISQRPKDEAVPLLIKIAKTHAKPEVRKQAIFWLGQTGDERALEFFKELLSK